MLLALEAAGYEVTGLDLSRAMGRISQIRLRRAGRAIPLVRGDARALPFPAAAFDTIFTTFPAEFILQPASLVAFGRVLRPGGRLVIVMAGFLAGRGPLRRFLEWLYRVTGQRPAGQPDEKGGIDLADSPLWRSTRQRFTAAGFSARLEHVRLDQSEAIVVVADRAGGQADS
jgi:ubiquinone/menaquinone biosynthesis C-methylase UbiE